MSPVLIIAIALIFPAIVLYFFVKRFVEIHTSILQIGDHAGSESVLDQAVDDE